MKLSNFNLNKQFNILTILKSPLYIMIVWKVQYVSLLYELFSTKNAVVSAVCGKSLVLFMVEITIILQPRFITPTVLIQLDCVLLLYPWHGKYVYWAKFSTVKRTN